MIRTLTTMLIAFILGGCSNDPSEIEVKMQLTSEEQKYIQDHKVVTWVVEPNRPPFVYVENAEVKGISQEYLKLISEKTGLIFKPVRVKNYNDGMNAVLAGEVDIASTVRAAPHLTDGFFFTSPYVYNAGVFLFRLNSQPRSPLRAGICQGDSAGGYLFDRFPDMKITQTEDTEEAVSLLEKGLLDVAVMNEASADYFSSRSIIQMRKANADFDYPYSFAVKKNNVILGRILTKAIAAISVADKKEINESWKRGR